MTRRPPWLALSLAATLAVGIATEVGGTSPARTLLVAWFLFTCPGMALARLIDVGEVFEEVSFGVGLSIAINTIVALALVYLGLYTGERVFAVAAVLVLGAVAAGAGRVPRGPL